MTQTDLPPESWVPSLPADIRFRRMRGKMLVARHDKSVELDEVGAALFSRIDGETSVEAIADSFREVFEVDAGVAVADTRQFLAQLVDLNILVRDW